MALMFAFPHLAPYQESLDLDGLLPIASKAMIGNRGLDGEVFSRQLITASFDRVVS